MKPILIKFVLVLLSVTTCYGQLRLPIISNRQYGPGGPQVIPVANPRQFISIPKVTRVAAGADALAIAAPLLRANHAYSAVPVINPAVLNRVGTYGMIYWKNLSQSLISSKYNIKV